MQVFDFLRPSPHPPVWNMEDPTLRVRTDITDPFNTIPFSPIVVAPILDVRLNRKKLTNVPNHIIIQITMFKYWSILRVIGDYMH